ncbi:10421_t:CDS:2 [Gigaspora margarita]|uniref:10421_t:CDS:1 n=1 Tax=Gigaspora margarita TaxID=4874 RepID=A0ABN7UFH7_GIGMA|nr:10421_t:CDS:2 [Gigaspora margarita]
MSTEVSNLTNPTKIIDKKVFPDQSEDIFWQKASDANEETRDVKHSNFVITPPPPIPSMNTVSRHSRKSSRISWGLQTDFERHIGLLESKLAEIASQGNKHVNKSVGFEGTPLSTLGYHPERELSPDINFENEDDETHNPQESDEGLWLLWKSSMLLNNLRKKNENDYLRMNGAFGGNLLFSYCSPVVTLVRNWWCCGFLGLDDD